MERLKRFIEGETVAVCYDGKWSRAVEGEIIKNLPGQLWVKFVPWLDESSEAATIIASVDPETGNLGGWLIGDREVGIMRMLGTKGDWYSVYKLTDLTDSGYQVKAPQGSKNGN